MTESDKDISVREKLDNLMPQFRLFLKDVLKLDESQAIQIGTYFLNYFIRFKYFPLLDKEENEVAYPEIFADEIISNLILFLSLKYTSNDKLSPSLTIDKIEKILHFVPLINNIFYSFEIPPYLKLEDIEQIRKHQKLIFTFIPNLIFDEEYKKIVDHKAIRHIFDKAQDTDLLTNYLQFDRLENFEYPVSKEKIIHLMEENPYSFFSKFIQDPIEYNISNVLGYVTLGIKEVIEDLMNAFSNYYTKRMPEKTNEIQTTIIFFKELLKLGEGRLYFEMNRAALMNTLENFLSRDMINELLEVFCSEKKFKTFDFEKFNLNDFLNDYYDFVQYPLYLYSGKIRSGAFLIWRGFLTYLDSIQEDKSFRIQKGRLLETWAYRKAKELDFVAKKIVLIDPKKKPTPKYYAMKEQIKDFPEVLEINASFSEFDLSYYHEIDLAINAENCLFLIECKGTVVQPGKIPKFVQWSEKAKEENDLLKAKASYIRDYVWNHKDKDELFKNVKNFSYFQIKTEGTFLYYGDMRVGALNPQHYLNFLEKTREQINNGTFISHMTDMIKELKELGVIDRDDMGLIDKKNKEVVN